MSTAPASYPDRASVESSYRAHVDAGRVDTWAMADLQLVMGEREGVRFQDAYSGRWFVNCHCNGGVFNLGHRNPQVIAALRDAMDHVDVGNHHLVSAYRARAAEKLVDTTGGRLPGVVFGTTGGEAVDLAIKAARYATGRDGVVSCEGAYHGHTGLALATGEAKFREPFRHVVPGFSQVPYNDLAAMESAIGDATAAVILEAIPATLGFPMPEPGYLTGVAELCRERGALLIIDEVQTGLGRTGTFWYHEQEGIEPDVVVTGKGLGGGLYPIAATLMTDDVHRFTSEHPFSHVSTFGGSELGCVAVAEVCDIVTAPGFLDRVNSVGERLGDGLAGLPFTIRRRGMLLGLVFDDPHGGMSAMKAFFDAGVYSFFAGNDPSVLQFKPALIIDDDDVDWLIEVARRTFG
jgi:putrescine aminotransferase